MNQHIQTQPIMFSRLLCVVGVVVSAIITSGAIVPRAAMSQAVIFCGEVGVDVQCNGTGSLDIGPLTPGGSQFGAGLIIPTFSFIKLGGPTGNLTVTHTGLSGPPNFGPGGGTNASSGTVAQWGADGSGTMLLPQGYTGGPLPPVSSVYNNATFASLGMTPGTYVWSWGAPTDQKMTLNIPEPSSTLCLSVLGLCVAGSARFRKYLSRIRKIPKTNCFGECGCGGWIRNWCAIRSWRSAASSTGNQAARR